MSRQHPNPQMSVPISLDVWHQLLRGSCLSGLEKESWEIAEEAINEWTRRHNPDAIPMPAASGYQWKSQFLPEGTVLRTVFGGKNHHCRVEGDQILYNGKPVSPSGFVNAVGGIRRNAWLCTWILFPDAKDWKRADTLRTPPSSRHTPKPAGDVRKEAAQFNSEDRANTRVAAAERVHEQGQPRNRRRTGCINVIPSGGVGVTDRRYDGDVELGAMLRRELLPLLHRMYGGNPGAPEPQNWRVSRTRPA
jgi:hypothetical protein